MIELNNIVKIYDINVENKRALDDVSLKIEDGELVAIMGPSGSGKSTLLNIIGCMDSATSGTYMLDGVDMSACRGGKLQEYRKEKIGFVFQHFALMDYYTAYENIELPLLARNVKRKDRKVQINRQLEALGITDVKDKVPSKMSGGQRQRVAIARALVTGCSVLLADEPTGALDQATGKEVINILKQVNSTGKTVIVVTHDESVAKQMNRIIRICDGRIQSDHMISEE